MALVKDDKKNNVDAQGRRLADGWLNIKITDKNGKEYNMGGFPLVGDKSELEKALLACGEGDINLNLSASITIVDHDPKAIELF